MKQIKITTKILLLFLFLTSKGFSQVVVEDAPIFDGDITSMTNYGDTIFYSGNFTKVASPVFSGSYGVGLNKSDGQVISNWAKPNNEVSYALSDGLNGYYISGKFTKVGDSTRYGLAHIDSLGRVLPEFSTIFIDGKVYDMAKDADTLYIGGSFNSIGTKNQVQFSNLGIINSTNQLKPNIKKLNGNVLKSIPDGYGGWYVVSGNNGTNYYDINRIDSLGNVLSFYAQTEGAIKDLALMRNKLFIVGYFNIVGGVKRKYAAAIDTATGIPDNWNVDPNNYILSIYCENDSIYLGGYFTTVGAYARNRIACFKFGSNAPTPWNPNVNSLVYDIQKYNNRIYISGGFTQINSTLISGIAAFTPNNINPIPWGLTSFSGYIYQFCIVDSSIYIGGYFTQVSGQNRKNLAKIKLSDASVQNWNPNITGLPINSYVDNLLFWKGKIWCAGNFSAFDSIERYGIAEIDTSMGTISNFDANLNDIVNTLALSGNQLFFGGNFQKYSGPKISKLVSIHIPSSTIYSWNTPLNGDVYSLEIYGNQLIVGGSFNKIGTSYLNANLTTFDKSTKLPTFWNNPSPFIFDGIVSNIEIYGDTTFFSGSFNSINGVLRSKIASLKISTRNLTTFNPGTINGVDPIVGIKRYGNNIIIMGSFSSIGTTSRNGSAMVDQISGNLSPWNPGYSPQSFTIYGNTLFCGGGSDIIAYNLATNSLIATFSQLGNGNIFRINATNNKLYMCSDAEVIGQITRYYFAAYRASTKTFLSWNPNLNNIVTKMEIINNKLYLGGYFYQILSTTRNYLASINLPSLTLTSWNPNLNSYVLDFIQSGSQIYFGGNFTTVGGITRNYGAAVDTATGVLGSWNPNANSRINCLAPFNTEIVLGGYFNTLGTTTRSYLGTVNKTTGTCSSWNPNITTGVVEKMVTMGNKLFISGGFTAANAVSRPSGLASYYYNSNTPNSWNPFGTNQTDGLINLKAINNRIYLYGSVSIPSKKQQNYLNVVDTVNGGFYDYDAKINDGQATFIQPFNSMLFINGYFKNINQVYRNKSAFLQLTETPTNSANNLYFSNITNTSIQVNWTNGNGKQRIVIARALFPITDSLNTGTNYNANSIFGLGSNIGSNSFVVYKGTGNSVNVTGLNASTNYYFSVVEGNSFSTYPFYQNTPYLSGTNITLPVSWLDFKGKLISENLVQLKWETASERNNRYFEIERSFDNVKFNSITKINSKGNSSILQSYNYSDNLEGNLVPNSIFYRIKQVDFDGKYSYSKTIEISIEKKSEIKVFPNPFSEFIMIDFSKIESNVVIEIYTLQGKLIYSKNVPSSEPKFIKIPTNEFPTSEILLVKVNETIFKLIGNK